MISSLKVSCFCHFLSLTQFSVAAGGQDFLAKKVDLSGARQLGSPAVEIKNEWLVVNNRQYSRKKAQDSGLGRIGQAVGPFLLTEPVLINFRTNPPPEWLEDNVVQTTTLTLTSDQFQQIDASVSGGWGPVEGDGSISTNSTHNASYVLHGFTFSDVFKIKDWFNKNNESEFVKNYRDMYTHFEKPRIITSVWVVAQGDPEEATSCVSGKVGMKYTGSGPKAGFEVSGTGCGRSTWTFSPDTILAYEASYLQYEDMFPVPPEGRVVDVPVDSDYTR